MVNANANLVTSLWRVEDPLLIVQSEAHAGVLDAGVFENNFAIPLIGGDVRGWAVSR